MVLWRMTVSGLVMLLWLVQCGAVMADKPAPPYSYKQVSPGGNFVFIMLSPRSAEEEMRSWNEATKQEIRAIRQVYSKSGLYRNDGSANPLWTVDWYAFAVKLSSDGVHLVRHGPWASSLDQEAISFFANGNLLREYQISELVSAKRLLPHTASHFSWCKESAFDDARTEYTVSTYDGNRFIFDVRTGEISSSSSLMEYGFGALAIVGTITIIIVVWPLARLRAKKISRANAA
jgi:hypothetical protein